MSDDTISEPASGSAGVPSVPEASSGFSRRSFLKAAALGTAAATLLNRGGLELGPASALAGASGCVDLSGNPCTANDVNIIGDVIVTNPCASCSNGTFTAQIQAQVQNNTSTGRYCIQLNLPPGSLGASQTSVVCVILSNKVGGGSTATPGANVMIGSVPNFPCTAGLITVSNATIGWSTSSGSAGCTIPTFVPGGQCHRQTIQFVNFQASLSCGNGTQNCTAPCTGLATLTACVIADPTELPVTLTLTNNQGLGTQTGTISSVDANFSGCTSFTATLTQNTTFTLSATDKQGCTRSGIQKSVAFSSLSAPSLTVSPQTCASGSTVFTASPSGLTDYTFQVDATNYDNGTNPVLTLSTLASGSHSAKVTAANSLACTAASPSSAFTVPTAVQIPSFTASTASCAGNNVTLTATATGGSGSYTFTFSEGTHALGTSSNGTFTVVAPSSGAHTYTVSVSDGVGCGTTANASTTVPTPVTVQSFTASTASCAGNNVTLTAVGTGGTGSYTYAFSEGTVALGTSSNGTFTVVAPSSGAHTYTVSITDSNACDNATANASTTVPPAVTTSVDLGTNTNCAGSITFTATGTGGTGSYTFAWTVDSSPVLNNSTNMLTYTPSGASSFGVSHSITVTATDSNGCVSTNTASRTLTECVGFTVT